MVGMELVRLVHRKPKSVWKTHAPQAGAALCFKQYDTFLYCAGDEEFDELCFDFGIELDEVVQFS